MDLPEVGEKILSSVRSTRSLGLLPSTSDRPEVDVQNQVYGLPIQNKQDKSSRFIYRHYGIGKLLYILEYITDADILCRYNFVDRISNAKWELKELGLEHNGFPRSNPLQSGLVFLLNNKVVQLRLLAPTFILAYYLLETEYRYWASGHPEYSRSQSVRLVNPVAAMKGWKRKTRLEVLEKVESTGVA